VSELDLPNLRALAYAASLRQPTLAVHVCPDPSDTERFLREWKAWGDHLPLEIISSPYRALVPPLTQYIKALHSQKPELTITVVMSELVVARLWQRPLHVRSAERIRRALRSEPNTVVTVVPFHLALASLAQTAPRRTSQTGRKRRRPTADDNGR
jgi:hypothetical protein